MSAAAVAGGATAAEAVLKGGAGDVVVLLGSNNVSAPTLRRAGCIKVVQLLNSLQRRLRKL